MIDANAILSICVSFLFITHLCPSAFACRECTHARRAYALELLIYEPMACLFPGRLWVMRLPFSGLRRRVVGRLPRLQKAAPLTGVFHRLANPYKTLPSRNRRLIMELQSIVIFRTVIAGSAGEAKTTVRNSHERLRSDAGSGNSKT
jgi:hypothetical protein